MILDHLEGFEVVRTLISHKLEDGSLVSANRINPQQFEELEIDDALNNFLGDPTLFLNRLQNCADFFFDLKLNALLVQANLSIFLEKSAAVEFRLIIFFLLFVGEVIPAGHDIGVRLFQQFIADLLGNILIDL